MRPAFVIAPTFFHVTFDVTAVIVAMPRSKAELGLDVAGFAWVMDAHSLAFMALLLVAGALADRHGRRRAALREFVADRLEQAAPAAAAVVDGRAGDAGRARPHRA